MQPVLLHEMRICDIVAMPAPWLVNESKLRIIIEQAAVTFFDVDTMERIEEGNTLIYKTVYDELYMITRTDDASTDEWVMSGSGQTSNLFAFLKSAKEVWQFVPREGGEDHIFSREWTLNSLLLETEREEFVERLESVTE